MKTIGASAAFMLAMHRFDMDAVRKTATYQAMVAAEDATKVDEVIQQMFAHLRSLRDEEPENWAIVMQGIAEQALIEKLNGGESINVEEDVGANALKFKLDNKNPRQ